MEKGRAAFRARQELTFEPRPSPVQVLKDERGATRFDVRAEIAEVPTGDQEGSKCKVVRLEGVWGSLGGTAGQVLHARPLLNSAARSRNQATRGSLDGVPGFWRTLRAARPWRREHYLLYLLLMCGAGDRIHRTPPATCCSAAHRSYARITSTVTCCARAGGSSSVCRYSNWRCACCTENVGSDDAVLVLEQVAVVNTEQPRFRF